MTFQAVQRLQQLLHKRLSDPVLLFSRLLAFFDMKYDGMDVRVRREIARIAHRVFLQVLAQNQEQNKVLMGEDQRKDWQIQLERVHDFTEKMLLHLNGYSSKAASLSYAAIGRAANGAIHDDGDEKKGVVAQVVDGQLSTTVPKGLAEKTQQHFNGYSYEIECMLTAVQALVVLKDDAVVRNLQVASQFLWKAAVCVVQMNVAGATEFIAKGLAEALHGAWKDWQLKWYGTVMAIEALSDVVVDNGAAVQQIVGLMADSKRAEWHLQFACLKALERAALHSSKDPAAASLAVSTIESNANFREFWLKDNWRVREKVAEIAVLLHHAVTAEVKSRAQRLYVKMKLGERDPRVRYTLDHAEELTAIQAALKKEWPKVEDEVTRQLNEQKQEIELLKQQVDKSPPVDLKQQLEESTNRFDAMVHNLEDMGQELQVVIRNLQELKRDVEQVKQSVSKLVSLLQQKPKGNCVPYPLPSLCCVLGTENRECRPKGGASPGKSHVFLWHPPPSPDISRIRPRCPQPSPRPRLFRRRTSFACPSWTRRVWSCMCPTAI